MSCLKFVKHAVDRQGLLANRRLVEVTGFGEHSVVIPLDVRDFVLAENRIDLVENV